MPPGPAQPRRSRLESIEVAWCHWRAPTATCLKGYSRRTCRCEPTRKRSHSQLSTKSFPQAGIGGRLLAHTADRSQLLAKPESDEKAVTPALRSMFAIKRTEPYAHSYSRPSIFDWGDSMNIHDTLLHVFPSENFRPHVPARDGFFELQGLRRGIAPRNCERLASGLSKARLGQVPRASYLVRTTDFLLFFRACPEHTHKACPGFSMSCGFAPLSSPLSKDLEAYALRSIAAQD